MHPEPFKTPVLVILFRISGLVWISITFALLVLALIGLCTRGIFDTDSSVRMLFASVGTLLSALLAFGFAQICLAICKTAYNSDRILDLLTNVYTQE